MEVLSHFLDRIVLDEDAVRFGSPTLSVIHFFKRPDLHYPPQLISSVAAVHAFTVALYKTLIFPVERCMRLPRYADVPGQWVCPCGGGRACGEICRAVRARLSILQVAAIVARMNGEDLVLGYVYRHIDAHAQLLCALDTAARATWQRREGPDAVAALCSDASLSALLEKYPITLDCALTVESLPDVSPLLLLAMAFNSPNNGMSAKKIFQSKFPHMAPENIARVQKMASLVFKGLPIRCYNRQLWSTIRRCCVAENTKRGTVKMDNEFVSFFFKMVMASALGVYPGAEKLDDVAARMRIYTGLHAPIPVTVVLDILTVGNKLALLYITREFLREMISRSSGIMEALAKTHNWDVYIRNIDVVTGMIRAQMRQNVVALPRTAEPWRWATALFDGIDTRVQTIHNHSRGSQREKTVNFDVYLIMKTLRDFNFKSYVDEMDRRGEFIGREYLRTNPNPPLTPQRMALMRQLVATFPKTHWVPLDWLVCFGVKPTDIAAVEAALFDKMSTLMDRLKHIKEVDPEAYAVFYNFFRVCREHRDYREYMADTRMYAKHALALHRYHGVPVDGHIPEVLCRLEVCPSCGDFKRASFFPPLKRNKSTGGAGVNRRTSDNRTVCGRRHKAPNWRAVLTANRANCAKAAARKKPTRFRECRCDDEENGDNSDDDDDDYDILGGEAAEDDEDYDILGAEVAEDEEDERMKKFSAFFEGKQDAEFNPLHDLYLDAEDDGDDMLLPDIKGGVRVSSVKVQRRAYARLVATQHILTECFTRETFSINTRGRFAVYNRVCFISCTRCLAVIPLAMSIEHDEDKLCTSCYDAVALQSLRRPVCEVACNPRNARLGEHRRILVYDDTADDPALNCFRTMVLCAYHGSFPWVRECSGVPLASHILRGLCGRWGTHTGPNGSYIQPLSEDDDEDDKMGS